jgi:hypothetical protein
MKQQKPQIVTIVEQATIRTSRGQALLYKCWCESSLSLISIWTDKASPNPFIADKTTGDTIRVIREQRLDVDLNGKEIANDYFTPIPDAPSK